MVEALMCLEPVFLGYRDTGLEPAPEPDTSSGNGPERLIWGPRLEPQPVVPVPIPVHLLVTMNAEIASQGYEWGGSCHGDGWWTYSILGRTRSGHLIHLDGSCLRERIHSARRLSMVSAPTLAPAAQGPTTDVSAGPRPI
ncbi:hypothetical protein [Terrabacter sp. MAHUQ-38]|uniref:hypothetical protein n=1 Tax=unclassified Terrabacter TaxID=2630222 RepID=UPI00165D911A|nr:hypothetical protein [Terrabacter sp. MAHUQ-38]MBC9824006.1 hypothetical protein [Terrabacter sp. MAHUQ-38]